MGQTSTPGVAIDLPPEECHKVEAALAGDIEICGEFLISDDPEALIEADAWRILVPDGIGPIMSVIHPRRVDAIMRLDDINTAELISVADGCHVYSMFADDDLSLDTVTWEVIRRRAHGHHLRLIASEVGYSRRQVIRICAKIRAEADVEEDFPWPTLAPLFPCPGPE